MEKKEGMWSSQKVGMAGGGGGTAQGKEGTLVKNKNTGGGTEEPRVKWGGEDREKKKHKVKWGK